MFARSPHVGKKSYTKSPAHPDNVVVYALRVPVHQVDLFRVDILHRLPVQTVVFHVFIVGFVYVPLLSDERR